MLTSTVMESVPKSIRILRKFVIESLAGDITLQQFRTMKLISEGYGPSLIAETLSVSLAAVSKMLSGLESKNFITKSPGKDRREQVLKLTPQGKKILTQVRKHVEKKLAHGISQLDSSEQKILQNGLEVLNKLMSMLKEG
jgi:DNA-binding MarR family transcriptional regulator